MGMHYVGTLGSKHVAICRTLPAVGTRRQGNGSYRHAAVSQQGMKGRNWRILADNRQDPHCMPPVRQPRGKRDHDTLQAPRSAGGEYMKHREPGLATGSG